MGEKIRPSYEETIQEINKMKDDISNIRNNELVHINKEINDLKRQIPHLNPVKSSFYLGILFILFIDILSFLLLPIELGIGVSIASLGPVLLCVYAITK